MGDLGRLCFPSRFINTHRDILGAMASEAKQRSARLPKSLSREDIKNALAENVPHQCLRIYPPRLGHSVRKIVSGHWPQLFCLLRFFFIRARMSFLMSATGSFLSNGK